MNKYLITGILGVLLIGVVAVIAVQGPRSLNGGVYCSSDGTLIDTMPIQSHRSYCIKSDSSGKTYAVNTPNGYSFSIVDDQGNTLKNLEITHTKQMHVIVVRGDLANFQHLHPEYDPNSGRFTVDIMFPSDGRYRVFADFVPRGGQMGPDGVPLGVTISEDISVGNVGAYVPQPLENEQHVKTFDVYDVTLSTMPQSLKSGEEAMLTFSLNQNGKPITDLEEYLGALGHSVALREETLDFIHAHPMDNSLADQRGKVAFMVTFPQEGTYKIFTQFQRNGKVFVTDYVVYVAKGTDTMPGMDHEMTPEMQRDMEEMMR